MPALLSINNYYYRRGGAETVFLEHNNLFQQLGWQVAIFAMAHKNNLPSQWSRYFVDEIEFGSDYSSWDRLVRATRVIYSVQARTRLASLLKTIRPDVCHAHNIYHHISPSILGLLHTRGIPTILTLHDLKIACPAYNMLSNDGICEKCKDGKIYNVAVNRCIKTSRLLSTIVMFEAGLHKLLGSYEHCVDRFIVPSKFYASKLVEWGWSADRFCHVPNFIDAGQYRPDFEPGERFVYFGRLSHEKGLYTLLHAAAQSRCKLDIVGSGPDLDGLRRLANNLGVDCRFLGYLSGERLHDCIRSARAVLLPSEWYENAPMSVLESYALGKPVIAARIGGIPELIHDEVTGRLFESGEAPALALVLSQFKAIPLDRIRSMGIEGRALVEKSFSVAGYLRNVLSVYNELGVKTDSVKNNKWMSA